MSISSIGTDIIEIERIRKSLATYGKKFLDKLLTHAEQEELLELKDIAPRVAGKFAAKEAVAKALGTGFGENLSFHDIIILKDVLGKPTATLSRKAHYFFDAPSFQISISHCKTFALAVAIKLESERIAPL